MRVKGLSYLELGTESKKFYVLFTNVSIDDDQKKPLPGLSCLCVTFLDEIFLHECKDGPCKRAQRKAMAHSDLRTSCTVLKWAEQQLKKLNGSKKGVGEKREFRVWEEEGKSRSLGRKIETEIYLFRKEDEKKCTALQISTGSHRLRTPP